VPAVCSRVGAQKAASGLKGRPWVSHIDVLCRLRGPGRRSLLPERIRPVDDGDECRVRVTQRNRPAPDSFSESLTFDQLLDDAVRCVGLFQAVNLRNVRMIQ
jgi:hypothetical protein